MSLQIGIVGLPNVGKSTLFKALTRQLVEIANYPFATIDPHVGVVAVPDERLQKLAELSHSAKIVPAAVEFVDIAGLVKGAAQGEGLGNQFLSRIREADAIAEVVRVFEDSDIIHVSGTPDPVSDIEVLEYELILKDLETVSKRLESIERDVRAHRKGAYEEKAMLEEIKNAIASGKKLNILISETRGVSEINTLISSLQLLTAKPFIYVFNVSERQLSGDWQPEGALHEKMRQPAGVAQKTEGRISSAPWVCISAKIEAELSDLNDEEREEYFKTLGLKESGLEQLIRIGYQTLGLITFFTTGEDETRAWTIAKDSPAPRAGRAIHSDFEEKFIRADVINWQKLLGAGSWSKARELGQLRTEGKEYIVQDGDVIEFKI